MTADYVHKDFLKRSQTLQAFLVGFCWIFNPGTEDTDGSVLLTQQRWGCTRHPYASTSIFEKGEMEGYPFFARDEISGIS